MSNIIGLDSYKNTNIEKGFVELDSKKSNVLEKSKEAAIGSIHIWEGKKFVKTSKGWSPFKDGKFDRSKNIKYPFKSKSKLETLENKYHKSNDAWRESASLMESLKYDMQEYQDELMRIQEDQEELIMQDGGPDSENGNKTAQDIGGKMNKLESNILSLQKKIDKLEPKIEKLYEEKFKNLDAYNDYKTM